MFKRFNEQMTSLLRRKSAEKQNVASRIETPFQNLPRFGALAQHPAVGHIERFDAMRVSITTLQGLRHNHGPVRKLHRRALTQPKHRRCQPAPFLSLPIQTLHRHSRLLSQESWQKGEQSRTQRVIVHHVISLCHGMGSAQQRVYYGLQMLGSDSW